MSGRNPRHLGTHKHTHIYPTCTHTNVNTHTCTLTHSTHTYKYLCTVSRRHTTQSIKYTISEDLLTPSNIHACIHTHTCKHTCKHTCTHTNTVGLWGEVQIRGCPEPHEWATQSGCHNGTSSGFQPTCDPKCRWWQG